jgi:hypothetical protein
MWLVPNAIKPQQLKQREVHCKTPERGVLEAILKASMLWRVHIPFAMFKTSDTVSVHHMDQRILKRHCRTTSKDGNICHFE